MFDIARRSERAQRAREAALEVAARLGIREQQAVILEDWNNTIVSLTPPRSSRRWEPVIFETRGLSPSNESWPSPSISRRAERPSSRRRERSRLVPTTGTS
jgi:hypothetical protein